MKKIATLSLSLLLAACGGGGGSGSTTSTADSVTTASTATAQQLGLAAVPGGAAGETGYNLVAAIGDSWRLYLDETQRTFRLFIVSSQYGLTTSQTTPLLTGSFTVASDGSYAFTSTNSRISVKVDKRTMSIAGSITVNNIASDVSGSGYAPSSTFDFTKLNGTYVYGGKTRTAATTNAAYGTSIGTYNVSGPSVTVCPNSYYTAPASCSNSVTPIALTASWDTAIGAIRLRDASSTDYGIVQVNAGDRGAVMLIDVASAPYTTYGAYYGIKTTTLTGTEGNGTWKRADGLATATVSGSSVTATFAATPTQPAGSASYTLTYNQTIINNAIVTYNGFFRGAPPLAGIGLPFAGIPLSSSVILIGDTSGLSVWSRQ